MMREERWENTGRDRITLQELMELNEDGFEFTLADGHIISVAFRS
ncbi:MAG: hypothetical protein ACLTJE_16450 [Enterocloster bolteae]|nr:MULTISPECIES: hypothetical protein [Hungatella]